MKERLIPEAKLLFPLRLTLMSAFVCFPSYTFSYWNSIRPHSNEFELSRQLVGWVYFNYLFVSMTSGKKIPYYTQTETNCILLSCIFNCPTSYVILSYFTASAWLGKVSLQHVFIYIFPLSFFSLSFIICRSTYSQKILPLNRKNTFFTEINVFFFLHSDTFFSLFSYHLYIFYPPPKNVEFLQK